MQSNPINYSTLTDDEKIKLGIEFTARGIEMPHIIKEFLVSINLYEAIINPKGE